MRRLALPEPPPGYVCARSARSILWVREECAADFERDGPLERSSHAGRAPLGVIVAGGARCLVRRYRHGGLLRWLTGARFLDARRPFEELLLSERLRARGIPTPLVVAARARRAGGIGWRLELATREVPDAEDLAAVLDRVARGALASARLAAILRALGAFVARLHDEGVLHADLQPANVLIARASLDGAPPAFWVLDLDRSRLERTLGVEARAANLARLLRHVRRRGEEEGGGLARAHLARFLAGYEPEREARRRLWLAIRERIRGTLLVHRAGWWLERRFGGKHFAPRPA